MIRRFLSQPTMKLFRQAKTDHLTPRAFHQHKASDDRSKGDPDNQASNGSKRDGHGDTPAMLMATEPQIILRLGVLSRIDACHGADGFRLPCFSQQARPTNRCDAFLFLHRRSSCQILRE